jgi:hypothetical protein
MLKGKTIQTSAAMNRSSLQKGAIINSSTIISEQPGTTMLEPKKVINACSGFEPIFEKDLGILRTSNGNIFSNKKISNESNTNETIEIIERTKNLRYSIDLLKSKFPGYSTLHYIELLLHFAK